MQYYTPAFRIYKAIYAIPLSNQRDIANDFVQILETYNYALPIIKVAITQEIQYKGIVFLCLKFSSLI
jgi:hypothetical protein